MRKPLFTEWFVLAVVVLLLHAIATYYHLYWSIYEFDSIVHFLAGAGLAMFFIWLYYFSGFFKPREKKLRNFFTVAFWGSVFVSVCWEIYEIIFQQTMVQKTDYPYDLFMDLLMDLLGCVVGIFYAYLSKMKLDSLTGTLTQTEIQNTESGIITKNSWEQN